MISSTRSRSVREALLRTARAWVAISLASASGAHAIEPAPTGHPLFASPHANPLALSPDTGTLYVVNTPADTLDVVDTATGLVSARVPVGLDPVSLAVRPDGLEVWVSNHVSDTVSVVDTDPASSTFHRVVATITAWKPGDGYVTDFDEPSGIAFASDQKAYVALSSVGRIAVVDVATRTVTSQFQVKAQEPRAIAVRGERLYVLPFEGMNQTELSGCFGFGGANPAPGCTFNILSLGANSNDAILTRNMVADIIRNPLAPDRDLFVYDTADESLLHEVSTLGTLLYGLAVDSAGRVFVALTEARNDANGLTGTAGHDLPELENRAFLNQVASVDCSSDCSGVTLFDLEPAPPLDPGPGNQLATPFGIQVSDDDAVLVAVAASSSRLFTMDAASGATLGTTDVGAIPRGLVLRSAGDGSPETAWVFNAIANSISVVDVSTPGSPAVTDEIPLDDPTPAAVKAGRIAFNDATASTTGTFSCGSCHPDAHTDQLLWNLGARCVTPGCDQVQPRTTMPVRGLRGTLPLHWDGVPGDPFGGTNAELADSGQVADPNCSDEHSCMRNLVDGAMSGTMCKTTGCPTDENELFLPGAFDEATRDALSIFIANVPYPPARERRLDDTLSPVAATGFRYFLIGTDDSHPGCSRNGACHSLPFWAGSNTPGTGFDAPTFRGIPDRHLLLPNGRSGMWELVALAGLTDADWDPQDGPDEFHSWALTFGTEDNPLTNRNSLGAGPTELFQLFLESSMGFSGALGRQVTLDAASAASAEALAILARLEEADADGVVNLHADGVRLDGGVWSEVELAYEDGAYEARQAPDLSLSSAELVALAGAGEAVVTVTARLGPDAQPGTPQPELWLGRKTTGLQFSPPLQQIPHVSLEPAVNVFGRHLAADPIVLVDGRKVDGEVTCQLGGTLPDCDAERIRVDLGALPSGLGDHVFQVATAAGLTSNEVLLIRDECPLNASFEVARCRLGTLRDDTGAATAPGKILTQLEKKLDNAEEKAERAEAKLALGKGGAARRQLRGAGRQLKRFAKRAASKKAQAVLSPEDQVRLEDEATTLRGVLTTLRETL